VSSSFFSQRQQAFLNLYLVVREVTEATAALANGLEERHEAFAMFRAERAAADYTYHELDWDHVWPQIDNLDGATQEEQFKFAAADLAKEIEIVLRHATDALPQPSQKGGNPRVLAEVVDRLHGSIQDLNDVVYRWAIGAFGQAGGYWFYNAASCNPELVSKFETSLSPSDEVELVVDLDAETKAFVDHQMELRDEYIYNQVMEGIKYKDIIDGLRDNPEGWRPINSIAGVKKAAQRHAENNSLPPPQPRSGGRPKNS